MSFNDRCGPPPARMRDMQVPREEKYYGPKNCRRAQARAGGGGGGGGGAAPRCGNCQLSGPASCGQWCGRETCPPATPVTPHIALSVRPAGAGGPPLSLSHSALTLVCRVRHQLVTFSNGKCQPASYQRKHSSKCKETRTLVASHGSKSRSPLKRISGSIVYKQHVTNKCMHTHDQLSPAEACDENSQ